jgi:hypothetical protein
MGDTVFATAFAIAFDRYRREGHPEPRKAAEVDAEAARAAFWKYAQEHRL